MSNDRGNELDWIGPKDESKHLIYSAQSSVNEKRWFFSEDLIELDPDYSEFSVRIHDPRCRSLSFIYKTLAILPKSKIRVVVSLLQAYLDMVDSNGS